MVNYSKRLVGFKFKVDETVRYQCRSEDYSLISDKEIFRIGANYFFYMFNRNGKNSTYSLRDMSMEEYLERKSEFFKLRPNGKFGKFKRGDNEYFIACFKDIEWEKNMPMSDVVLEKDSIPKQMFDEYKKDIIEKAIIEQENEQYSRRAYARICGALSKRLGISYVNVLRIGTDEYELLEFKDSYKKAIEAIKQLPLSLVRYFYNEIFKNSRNRRRAALDELGVKYFEADVLILDLKELEETMLAPLNKYTNESVFDAGYKAAELDFDKRIELSVACSHANTRASKKNILSQLGVDIDAIDIKTYPFARVKYAVQASIGLDNY